MCLLVGFGKELCSSANELQQNSNTSSREDYIAQILTRIKKWYKSAETAATETRVNVMYPLTELCDDRHVSATALRVYAKFPFTDS